MANDSITESFAIRFTKQADSKLCSCFAIRVNVMSSASVISFHLNNQLRMLVLLLNLLKQMTFEKVHDP